MLKSIKTEGGKSEAVYKRLYPTGAGSPKFYGLPKIHKEGMPLRPIVSSIGAVIYATSKELSRILKPLVGRLPYHIQNTQDFIQQIEGIQLQPNQCIVSFDREGTFHISVYLTSHHHHKEAVGRRSITSAENNNVSE